MKQKRVLILIILLCSSIALFAYQHYQSRPASITQPYSLKTLFQADDVVWSFAFISPDELLITLRKGKLIYLNLANHTRKTLTTPPVIAEGQGGLLDVQYQTVEGRAYIYLTYTTRMNGHLTTALARGEWQQQQLTNLKTLFTAKVKGDSGRHFGSRLLFHDGYIYMTVGERGERDYAQNLAYHNGKILRLTLDGKAAAANPFIHTPNALPEIWSYGHRNPQGIDIDPVSGALYSCELGPRGGDELNHIQPGKNYGWPIITYGKEYWGPEIGTTHQAGMEQPVSYWVPSISPSGMAFYRGDKIPEWQNQLFLANMGSTHLRRLMLKNNLVIEQEVLFAELGERIRHVRNGPDGYLYFSTDSGKIIRVSEPDA